MENYEQWTKVVAKGLERALSKRDEPIPGARLRVLISRCASEAGLSYPPTPGEKFKDFLFNFRDIAEIVEREDQDFVVVPVDRTDLLTKVAPRSSGEALQLRKDLFLALTRIHPDQKAWYDPDLDRVSFRNSTEPGKAQELELPAPSLESELALRKRFAESVTHPGARESLENSLETERPLSTFSRSVHAGKLKGDWHQFRTAEVLSRLRSWAQEHGVAWRNSWLVTEPSRPSNLGIVRAEGTRTPQQRVAALILSLEDQEFARILIPADLLTRLPKER
jgi:hypothetical protein